MKRRNFILSSLATIPAVAFSRFINSSSFRTVKGYVVNSGEARFGKHFDMKGVTHNTLDIKISGQDTDGELAVFEQTGHTYHGGPPLHVHLNQDEWFYILEGEYIFQVGDEKYRMKKGDTIFLPRKVQHGFIQLTEQARVIVSYLPAGKIEEFFKVTDSWTTPPTHNEMKQVFEDFDMKIVGPPLKI